MINSHANWTHFGFLCGESVVLWENQFSTTLRFSLRVWGRESLVIIILHSFSHHLQENLCLGALNLALLISNLRFCHWGTTSSCSFSYKLWSNFPLDNIIAFLLVLSLYFCLSVLTATTSRSVVEIPDFGSISCKGLIRWYAKRKLLLLSDTELTFKIMCVGGRNSSFHLFHPPPPLSLAENCCVGAECLSYCQFHLSPWQTQRTNSKMNCSSSMSLFCYQKCMG